MKKSNKKLPDMEGGNLISDLTDGKVTTIPFGGDVPKVGFSLSEWQKAYLINGSYATRNTDGSPITK